MVNITLIYSVTILFFCFVLYLAQAYKSYYKLLKDFYKLKTEIYDNFSIGEQQNKYKDYILKQIDYNIAFLEKNKIWKISLYFHLLKEFFLLKVLRFPSTVEQEDIYNLHINNIKFIGQTLVLPSVLTNSLKKLADLSSFNYNKYFKP